jgi:dipeptidyl aminopeptidase/acylaminoacyl peptidase
MRFYRAAAHWALALGFTFTGFLAVSAQAADAAPPVAAFASLPLVQQVALSPDGSRYAILTNNGDNTVLATREMKPGAPMKALLKTDNRESQFRWIKWVSNERLLVGVRYPGERGWTGTVETRLLSMRFDGSDRRNLIRQPSYSSRSPAAQFQDQVVDFLPEDGHHVLLALDDEEEPLPSVFKVNVDTGRRIKVQGARTGVHDWLTDGAHQVRVAIKQEDARVEIQACEPDGSRWRTLWSFEQFSIDEVWPLGFGKDPQRLYVQANHDGHTAVFEVNLADPALPRKLMAADPQRDVGGRLLHDPKSGEAVGIITDGALGDGGAHFWDPAYRSWMGAIDKALPQRFNRLINITPDGRKYLLKSSGNGVPPQYFIGERASGELAFLAQTYPDLDAERLPRKQPLQLQARDGTALPALLSLPPGADGERKPLPTVVLPHGGPISNDTLDFDPWAAFLATRGYAVLQVNFRGSEGLGHAHMQAGLKRWGLEMQDDLSDALAALVRQGVADPRRVCIVGGSYGGYAALMGVAKTPDLYRCAVSFAGVTDLPELASHQAKFVNGRAVFERMVGSTWDDMDQLKATSPSRLAAQVKVPVLLVHGTQDRRVPFEQSRLMADALERAGRKPRFIRQEDGDHHLGIQAHRLQFFQELEQFLAENLR